VLISRSATNTNAEANGRSIRPSISADGRYVAFQTLAYDANTAWDVYVYDRLTSSLACVSVNVTGAPAEGTLPAISANGRFTAFMSYTTNHVPNGAGWLEEHRVYVHDRQSGSIELVSVDATGSNPADGPSMWPAISADGKFVTFCSEGTNLVPGVTSNVGNLFRRDRVAGTTILVSQSTSGAEGNARCDNSAISDDGRCVAFESFASNLVATDTNNAPDVFLRDCVAGTTILVSGSIVRPGDSGDALSDNPWISADGRFVVFHSLASDLAFGDLNGLADVYLYDRERNVNARASLDCGGVDPDDSSDLPRMSPDGRWIVIQSRARDLVSPPHSSSTTDVFVRDACVWPAVNYCTAGISSSICVPGMSASGSPCVSATSGFVLTCTGLEGQRFGLIFYGVSGRLAMPWGAQSSSYLCVAPSIQRTPAQSSGGTAGTCTGAISVDWPGFLAGNPYALGAPFSGGEVVQAQCWYRDPPAPRTTNLSDAIEFVTCACP
jgi:Tol biopolymer transport system component